MGTTVVDVNICNCQLCSRSDSLTGGRTVESDDFGGATTGGIGIRGINDAAGQDLIATLVEGIVTMAAHMGVVGQGRAHQGGRGGQNSTPHDENGTTKRRIVVLF